MTINIIVYRIFTIICVLSFLNADDDLCEKLKPCGERGVCDKTNLRTSSNILNVKCYCRSSYTGQWCQFTSKYFFLFINNKFII